MAIVESRTGDLIALATGGSGILPAGNLHPRLIERLTHETCKVAQQMLRICLRALDYCPPVDITFGEYLRALMTSDLDHVPDDRLAYRTAILAAFRKRNLLPENLRTKVSIESLVWRRPTEPRPGTRGDRAVKRDDESDRKANWLRRAVEALAIDWGVDRDRYQVYQSTQKRRSQFWESLNAAFLHGVARPEDFGLQSGLPLWQRLLHRASTAPECTPISRCTPCAASAVSAASGTIALQIIIILTQRRPELNYPDDAEGGWFWFRGGATLVIDPFDFAFRYIITKNIVDPDRIIRHRASATGEIGGALRATYFDTQAMARAEPFAMLTR